MKLRYIPCLAATAVVTARLRLPLGALPWQCRPGERCIQSLAVPLMNSFEGVIDTIRFDPEKSNRERSANFASSLYFGYFRVDDDWRVYVCASAYTAVGNAKEWVGNVKNPQQALLVRMARLYTENKDHLVYLLENYRLSENLKYRGNLQGCIGDKPRRAVRLCSPSECSQDTAELREITAYVVYKETDNLQGKKESLRI